MNIKAIIEYLDDFLIQTRSNAVDPIEANALLAKAGLLRDSKDRPGKPLRDLLRKGMLPHAFQTGGKGSSWTIPYSKNGTPPKSKLLKQSESDTEYSTSVSVATVTAPTTNIAELKEKLETARLRYKPKQVKYLLIAEAPPDSIERFFYYENVRQHDYLFLGIAHALFPTMKDKYLASGRNVEIKTAILEKFQCEGFYLLDLSELPLSLLNQSLESKLPYLIDKIKKIAGDETKIILIKANVYDTVLTPLVSAGFNNVIDVRIPFPGQGGQKRFQTEFKKALKLAKYFNSGDAQHGL